MKKWQSARLETGSFHLIRGCGVLLTRATSRLVADLQTYETPRLQCVSLHAATAAVIVTLFAAPVFAQQLSWQR